ncbi:MAG: ubiquinone biosynthesis protein UbiB [Phycisphaerae bacterium]|jgi:ubiquinone biosynthesis protein|nr:MAG: ubiquinone biosynthesis protein UbiB [Phycisphaerae bacterium]
MPGFHPISDGIRHIQRYREILEVLISTGLADIVQELGLTKLMTRGKSLILKRPTPEIEQLTRPQRLRKALEQLGPTFIKMGQILSTRPDLIPESYANEFSHLQADAPTLPFSIIRQQLEEAFPGDVDHLFKQIDPTPLAAGSIAQTHLATFHTGQEVVIKVRRPRIDQITQTDIDILRTLARFVEHHFSNLGFSPVEVVNEFSRELNREIDFTHEGRATDRLRTSFQDDPGVIFPQVHWQATTRTVLCLQRIQGVLLSRLNPNDLDPEDRRRLVTNGARAVMRQTLELGFFHADPHPGNLIALDGGKIAFIDCGMIGQLDRRTSELLADLVHGVVTSDVEKVVRVIGEIGDVEPRALSNRVFLADVRDFIGHFASVPLEQLDIGSLLIEFFHKLRLHQLRCPGDLVLLIKALTTIEGVAEKIDPTFDLISVAQPYIERLIRQRYGYRAIRRRLQNTLAAYAQLAERFPADLKQVIDSLNRERLTINLEHHRLDRLTETIEHASRNIAWALVIAGLFVGSSILVLANRGNTLWGLNVLGILGFMTAGALVVLRVIVNRINRRNND